jgi:hypothetical protein
MKNRSGKKYFQRVGWIWSKYEKVGQKPKKQKDQTIRSEKFDISDF